MESKSQNQMGVALQVFFNLNVLPEKVEHVEITLLKNLKLKATECLDGKKINASLISEEASRNPQQSKNNLPGRSNRAISSVASSANIAGEFRFCISLFYISTLNMSCKIRCKM